MMDMEGIFIETETQVGTEISEIIMDQKILEEMTDIKIATIVVVTVAQEAMEIVRDLIIREDTNQTTKELIQGWSMLREMIPEAVQMIEIVKKKDLHLAVQDPIQGQNQKVLKEKGAQVHPMIENHQMVMLKKERFLRNLHIAMMIIDSSY